MDGRVADAMQAIRLQFSERWTLAGMAELTRTSKSHLYHLFKRETGLGPVQFVRSVRLAKARELLAHGSLSVKEVSALVGYGDQSHFVRDFKRIYGQQPSKYRSGSFGHTNQEKVRARGG